MDFSLRTFPFCQFWFVLSTLNSTERTDFSEFVDSIFGRIVLFFLFFLSRMKFLFYRENNRTEGKSKQHKFNTIGLDKVRTCRRAREMSLTVDLDASDWTSKRTNENIEIEWTDFSFSAELAEFRTKKDELVVKCGKKCESTRRNCAEWSSTTNDGQSEGKSSTRRSWVDWIRFDRSVHWFSSSDSETRSGRVSTSLGSTGQDSPGSFDCGGGRNDTVRWLKDEKIFSENSFFFISERRGAAMSRQWSIDLTFVLIWIWSMISVRDNNSLIKRASRYFSLFNFRFSFSMNEEKREKIDKSKKSSSQRISIRLDWAPRPRETKNVRATMNVTEFWFTTSRTEVRFPEKDFSSRFDVRISVSEEQCLRDIEIDEKFGARDESHPAIKEAKKKKSNELFLLLNFRFQRKLSFLPGRRVKKRKSVSTMTTGRRLRNRRKRWLPTTKTRMTTTISTSKSTSVSWTARTKRRSIKRRLYTVWSLVNSLRCWFSTARKWSPPRKVKSNVNKINRPKWIDRGENQRTNFSFHFSNDEKGSTSSTRTTFGQGEKTSRARILCTDVSSPIDFSSLEPIGRFDVRSYLNREAPQSTFAKEKSRSRSRSRSASPVERSSQKEKIEFITAFGNEDNETSDSKRKRSFEKSLLDECREAKKKAEPKSSIERGQRLATPPPLPEPRFERENAYKCLQIVFRSSFQRFPRSLSADRT